MCLQTHLELGQVLYLCQIVELEVERPDANEGEDVDDVEDEPGDEHDDVVREDQVVDDVAVDEGEETPDREDAHGPQPAPECVLLLLPKSVQQHHARHQKGQGEDYRHSGGQGQQITD